MVQRSLWYNHKDLFNNTSPSQATSKSFHKWMIKHIRDDFTASRPSHNMHKIISRGCSPSNLAINFHNLPSQSYRLDIGSRTRTRPRRRCRTRTRNQEFDLKKPNVLENLRALRSPERPLCEVLQTNKRSRYTNSVSFNATRLHKLSSRMRPLKSSEKFQNGEFISEIEKDGEWKKYLQDEFIL